MISKGNSSKEPYLNLSNLTQVAIAAYYLNVKSIPCLINSPLRKDLKPSFGLYCFNGTEVNYKDFSTNESGTIWTLLTKLWNCSVAEAVAKVYHDLKDKSYGTKIGTGNYTKHCKISTNFDLQCKIRKWELYDIEYWESYGISLKWLKYADIYPISHKIIIKNGIVYAFKADKYAYAYVEFKDNKTTLKIYQPFNKNGFKWSNKHDKSVISLWTKIPKYGDMICICSSVKDALCLWANMSIPSIAIQGEGYKISSTAINELKKRYKQIYILLDNDEPGIKDAEILSKETGFINLTLPYFKEGKDISDLWKAKGKDYFITIIKNLFKL